MIWKKFFASRLTSLVLDSFKISTNEMLLIKELTAQLSLTSQRNYFDHLRKLFFLKLVCDLVDGKWYRWKKFASQEPVLSWIFPDLFFDPRPGIYLLGNLIFSMYKIRDLLDALWDLFWLENSVSNVTLKFKYVDCVLTIGKSKKGKLTW